MNTEVRYKITDAIVAPISTRCQVGKPAAGRPLPDYAMVRTQKTQDTDCTFLRHENLHSHPIGRHQGAACLASMGASGLRSPFSACPFSASR